jgi:hypothetical protein
MCSPVKFAHSLSKKSRTVSSWELCIICQISCDDTLSKASEKGKCTLFKAVNSTQNKNKVYHKTNLNNNIKLQVFRTIYTGRNFFRNISCLFRSVLMNVFVLVTFPCINFTLIHDNMRDVKS